MEEYIDVVFTVGGTYSVEILKGNKTKEEVIEVARQEVDEWLEKINEVSFDLDLNIMDEPDIDWEDE